MSFELFKSSKINSSIIRISFLISLFYLSIQFIDSLFFFQVNLGDEWYFSRDLIYYLDYGYYNSVIHGISIPFTLLSRSIHYFLNEISLSLRLANSIIVFLLLIYLFFRKALLRTNHKLIFTTHLFLLIGTTGGIFYGTNDSFLFVTFFILCSESYLYLKGYKLSKVFLVFIFTICILSRPHFIIYFPILFISFYAFLLICNGFKNFTIKNPIIYSFFLSLPIVLLFNYPKILENNFYHNQGAYLPKYLFLSYSDKSDTYKTDDPDFNWIQWCFYSQMVSERKRFGLFAPFVEWDDVRRYKEKTNSKTLPKSYQEYILNYPNLIFKRVPFSIIEVSIYSVRYVGILLLAIPLWMIRKKSYKNITTFIPILIFVGIISWAIIMPNSIAQQRLMPFYLMLLVLTTDKKRFMFTFFNKNIININLIIIDFVMIYALVKWEVFRSL